MDDIALTVCENCSGAGGDLSKEEIVADISAALCDYAFEGLDALGVRPGSMVDSKTFDAVARLVAQGMLAQHRFDEEMWLKISADLVAKHRAGQVPGK